MPLRVFGLRLSEPGLEADLLPQAVRAAGIPATDVERLVIHRRSVDRRRGSVTFTYTVDLHLHGEGGRVETPRATGSARWISPPVLEERPPGDQPLPHRPVIVGSGPAGLFAAHYLARRGYAPHLVERGEPLNLRVRRIRDINRSGRLDPESNYLFGEGGAGTFSDGKLTSRSKDPRAAWVLEEFHRLSGVESVVVDYRPHLGSERIRAVVGRMRREIQELGATVSFNCRVERLVVSNGRLVGLATSSGEIPTCVAILAPGHSARDLFRALEIQGLPMEQKPFQFGLRVEHPQEFVDRAVWGGLAGHPALGAADYRLAVKSGDDAVFSFCMCPGGEIVPAVCDLQHMNTNGMSHTKRNTGYANSGLVTTVHPEAFGGKGPLAGVCLQEAHEARAAQLVGQGLAVPGQRLADYLAGRPSQSLPPSSCLTGVRPVDLADVLPATIDARLKGSMQGLDAQLPGFLHPQALLVGPEARSSSPVRLVRDEKSLESPGAEGLYPVGEGAGYAGGIVSAAVDGLRAAQAVERRFARPGSGASQGA